jgi:hypothetical protein
MICVRNPASAILKQEHGKKFYIALKQYPQMSLWLIPGPRRLRITKRYTGT